MGRHLPDRCCCKGRADGPTLVEIRFDDGSKSAGVGARADIGAPPAGDVAALGIVEAMASRQSIHQHLFTSINGKGKCMDHSSYSRGMTRRAFGVSFGPGMNVLAMAVANGAPLKKVPTATGIDALYVPFVVAAELKIFEKYGLETSYKPFDDGNVALDALLAGSSDIGATTELGGLSRWDKGGKLYVTSYSSTSGQQIGLAGRDDIKKPEDLIGRTVAYPRASGGH